MDKDPTLPRVSNITCPNEKCLTNDSLSVKELIDKHKTNLKGVGQPLRIALTGSRYGPGIYNIILSLKKDVVIKRLKN